MVSPQLAGAFILATKDRPSNYVLQETTTSSESKGSVPVDSVVKAIYKLFPPEGLEQRIALSRKDGYWSYISSGQEPPKRFVYGEFDITLLEKSLERSCELLQKDNENIVFCDLGSGTGRLVLAAAALHPNWKLCRGIELLTSIYEESLDKLESCRRNPLADTSIQQQQNDDEKGKLNTMELFSDDGPLPLAPIQIECASFDSPYSSFYDADILFCFSSCLNNNSRINLSRSIRRQCLPGTIVITTEYQLPEAGTVPAVPDDPDYPCGEYELELVDTFVGPCAAVGGESTVYLHRVLKSVGTGQRRIEPKLPVSELAYRAIQYMEKTDSTKFLIQVSNQMAFSGFPESWRPKI